MKVNDAQIQLRREFLFWASGIIMGASFGCMSINLGLPFWFPLLIAAIIIIPFSWLLRGLERFIADGEEPDLEKLDIVDEEISLRKKGPRPDPISTIPATPPTWESIISETDKDVIDVDWELT